MALTRASIVRGHGCIIWNPGASQVIIPCAGGIDADLAIKDFEVESDDVGKFDRRLADAEAKIGVNPLGILTKAILDVLYPAAYRNPVVGSSVFGAADVPVCVHSKAGQKVTFHSCAITKMPSLSLSAVRPAFGQMEISAIRGTGLEWSNAAALYTIAAASYADPTFNSADVKTHVYTAAWGSILASIVAEAGWTLDFTLDLQSDQTDGYGTNDYLMKGVGVVAKCRPKNLSETIFDTLKVQNAGVEIGMSRRRASNLVITSGSAVGDLTATLYDAVMLRGPLMWKGVEIRAGEIGFAASRAENAGAYGALFELAIATA